MWPHISYNCFYLNNWEIFVHVVLSSIIGYGTKYHVYMLSWTQFCLYLPVISKVQLTVDQSLNFVQLFVTPWTATMPGFPVLHHLPELAQTHIHWVSNAIQHLVLCHPLLFLPSIFPNIRFFSNESALCNRWPKYWSFSFSISPPNELSGLISFKIDWFDVLKVQGTLKSLLQHHVWKASVLQHSTFMVQISHPYVTTGKTIVLTKQTFVGKVMSLLFNMLSKLVIAFIPRSKCLFISWLQSLSAVVLEPKKLKSITLSIVSPSICNEVIGLDAMTLVFWRLSFKPVFHSPFSLLSRDSLVPLCFLP